MSEQALSERVLVLAPGRAERHYWHDFPAFIARLLAVPKPNQISLPETVRTRSGGETFRAQLGKAFDRLGAVP